MPTQPQKEAGAAMLPPVLSATERWENVKAIEPGRVCIKTAGRSAGKRVVVLADTAERADELEEEKIQKAREEAKHLMEQRRGDSEGFAEASAMLEREIARLKVAKRRRRAAGGHGQG